MPPEVSVVVPTQNRPDGLAALVDTLRAQSLAPERFEVIVVDDGSETPQHVHGGGLTLRVVRHERPRGPAAARNSGWHDARAPLVAFIDDDCVPEVGWLAALLEAADEHPALVIQGPIEPAPDQRSELTPLSHTIKVSGPTRLFVSCNIAFSRALLVRAGGFDESFKRACGEDVELGARVLNLGAEVRFAEGALVFHEVRQPSLIDLLRHTLKWTDSVKAVAMHPELRDLLIARIFWKPTHPRLLIAAAGLATRRPVLATVAALPYLSHYRRLYGLRSGKLVKALPMHLAVDICEIATALAGSIRHRTLMV